MAPVVVWLLILAVVGQAAVDVEPGESSQRVPQVVNRMAKEAAAMGTFRGDQPVRTPTLGHADVVSSTLDGLGKVGARVTVTPR